MTLTLDDLNRLDASGFVAALGGVFEHAPWVAEAVVPARPFASLAALNEAMAAAVGAAPAERRLALLRGHPDLAGKAARAGGLTAESTHEQASAGLDRLSEDEYERFHALNAAYWEKFDFPFIVCVRRHGKESILRSFARRLEHSPEVELAAALEEVLRIGALRLDQKVATADRLPLAGRLSTHVLDTHRGGPAAGISVELAELWGEERRIVTRAVTNADGRTDAPLIGGRPVPIARYELRFAVGDYFAGCGVPAADPPFLDVVPIRFAVAQPEGNYHVPLLLTPWGYTTYRGS